MSRAHCISLSDRQLAMLQRHSAGLKVEQRDRFLRVIADRLTGEVTDAALLAAINLALAARVKLAALDRRF